MKQFDTDTDDMQMSEDYKPTYINEQHNNNCQQFFGPISNCTFMMPAATPSSKQKPKADKPKTKADRKPGDKPMTLKYYKHGNKSLHLKQHNRVMLVFRKFNEWKWLDERTEAEDFEAFFEGEPKHCNITWTGNNTTILTILLQELLEQPYIERQIGCTAKSLVTQQFGFTANSDRTRLDSDAMEKIDITLYILDVNNPIPDRTERDGDERYDTSDAKLKLLGEKYRSTKGI